MCPFICYRAEIAEEKSYDSTAKACWQKRCEIWRNFGSTPDDCRYYEKAKVFSVTALFSVLFCHIWYMTWQEIPIDYHSNLCRDIVDQAGRQVEAWRESGGGNGEGRVR